jgi:hypothetical protein
MSRITRIVKPYQGLILPVILIAFCAGVLLFGVVPAVRGMILLQQESSVLNEQNRTIKAKIATLESIDESLLLDQLSSLTAAVPTQNAPAQMLLTVENISTQALATIVSVEIGSPGVLATESGKRQTSEEKQLGANVTPFTVTLEGTLDQIRNFMSQVVGVRQFLRVTKFTIAFNEEAIAKATIGMSGFFLPLPTSIGTAANELSPLSQDEEEVLTRVSRIPVTAGVSLQPLPPAAGAFRPDPFSP